MTYGLNGAVEMQMQVGTLDLYVIFKEIDLPVLVKMVLLEWGRTVSFS